jgi:dTDP-4-amino-4,6-dideoxygalactose transaminase
MNIREMGSSTIEIDPCPAAASSRRNFPAHAKLAIDGGEPVRGSMLRFGAPCFGDEEIAEVVDTLKSGWVSTGPKTKKFEEEFAAFVGAKYAIALNSCTAGLHLSLVVLGIGPGDEVIVPSMTFGATANVVEHVGARPVLVDIDPQTLCIDPRQVEKAITPHTRAIIPVHYGGMPADMDQIQAIAAQHRLAVVEDAAHAVGARYKGRKVGSISPLTNFSFYANKNLSTAEGGMVTTGDSDYEARLRVYHLHGLSRDAWKRYHTKEFSMSEVVVPGYKYNMTDIQASLGLHQLRKQEQFVARREALANYYDRAFRDLDIVHTVARPHDGLTRHVLHLYVLMLDLHRLTVNRNRVLSALLAENIGASVHFWPVHMHPYYCRKYGYQPGDLPVARRVGESVLSLPLVPQMTDQDAEDVVTAIYKVTQAYRQ